jgi:dihydrofolate reductase
MYKRKIGIIGAFDENGTFGIGSFLPWGSETGRSLLPKDMKEFVSVTKTPPEDGLKNVLVVGRKSFEAMGSRPLPGRYMVVLSQTLNEREVNTNLPDDKKIAVERNTTQAIDRALSFKDCGHIFFGGGETIWLEALKSGRCNTAHITHVICDSVARSIHKDGEIRRLPEMLGPTIYENAGMVMQPPKFDTDLWSEENINLIFETYLA